MYWNDADIDLPCAVLMGDCNVLLVCVLYYNAFVYVVSPSNAVRLRVMS